eukprot:74484_1
MPRKPRDKHAPNEGLSAFEFYEQGMKDKDSDVSAKELKRNWRVLSNTDKRTFAKSAKSEKIKYILRMEQYAKSDQYATHVKKVQAYEKKKKAPKKPKPPVSMPKRPMSSFFIYSKSRRPELMTEQNNNNITHVSKLLGSEWRNKTEDQKKWYVAEAKVLKQNYNEKMKIYKQTSDFKNTVKNCKNGRVK